MAANVRNMYSLPWLVLVVVTAKVVTGQECQLNCTAPPDPVGKIHYDLTRVCGAFPFGNDPSAHQWPLDKPRNLRLEERTYPCQNNLLLGVVVKWKPPLVGIDKVKGFQVRVTPLSAGEVGDYPIMCVDVILSNHSPLGYTDYDYLFSLDCFNQVHPGHKYYIEVQSLPKPMPGVGHDNTEAVMYTAKSKSVLCQENPMIIDCPGAGKDLGKLENYIFPAGSEPRIFLQSMNDITVTFGSYPDVFNVTSYKIDLCYYKGRCFLSHRNVKSYHTTFKNVEPGYYEALVSPNNCNECIQQASPPINLTAWKPSFVIISIGKDSTAEVYFDQADEKKIHNYTIELININTGEIRSLVVQENPAVFRNVEGGTYKARAKATRCENDCPWAVSESIQVNADEIPDTHLATTLKPEVTSTPEPKTTSPLTTERTPSAQSVAIKERDIGKIAVGVVGGILGGIILVIILYLVKRNIRKTKGRRMSRATSSEFVEETTYSIDETQCDSENDTDALICSTGVHVHATVPERQPQVRQYTYYEPLENDKSLETESMSNIIRKLNQDPTNQATVFNHPGSRLADGAEEMFPHQQFHLSCSGCSEHYGGDFDRQNDMYLTETHKNDDSPHNSNEMIGDKFDSGFEEMKEAQTQLEAMRTMVVEGLKSHTTTIAADVHNDSQSVNI